MKSIFRVAPIFLVLFTVVMMTGCARIITAMIEEPVEYASVETVSSATLNISTRSKDDSWIPSFSGYEYQLSVYEDPEGECAVYVLRNPKDGYVGDIPVDIEDPSYKKTVFIPSGKPFYLRSLFKSGGEMMCNQVYRFTPLAGQEYHFDFHQTGSSDLIAGEHAQCKTEMGVTQIDESGTKQIGKVPGLQYHRQRHELNRSNRLCSKG